MMYEMTEPSIVYYIFAGLISFCCLLGGLVIRQDRKRVDKLEVKQEEDGNLLHEMNGKMDIIISLVKNGIGKKKEGN